MENAARALRCAVDLGHAAVCGIGDADRPRRAGAVGDEADLITDYRQPQERNAGAVGDQRGSMSKDRLASSQRRAWSVKVYTPTKL